MKRILLVLLMCGAAWAVSPKTITSSQPFTDANNNVLANGTIVFKLANSDLILGGPQLVQGLSYPVTLTAGGLIPGATTIWATDQMVSTGNYFIVNIYNSNGLLVRGPENWKIAGVSPIDLALEVNSNVPDPGLSNPVLQNPVATQTITGQSLTMTSSAPLTTNGTDTFSGTNVAKNLNQIVFADQFAGADCGAKINAALAAITSTQGTVRVNTNCGSTIATTVAPGFGQKLWFDCGTWTLTVSPAFTLTSGSHLEGCGFSVNSGSPVITGTIFAVNTASLNAINFVSNANHVHISNIGFDGTSRTNVLGAAIALGSGNTANYVNDVAFANWNGTVISLATSANDNHFTNIQSSLNGSNSPSNLPCIDIQGNSNSNMFTNGQFDSCYYAAVRENSSGGGNSFTSFKIDTNTAPSGTIDIIFTGGSTGHGDKFANINLRADANAAGNCIEIDNAITDTTFVNVTCNTFAAPGASNIGFYVNSATAASIQVSNLFLNGFATGIKDISAANSNGYVNIQYGTNTANTNFTHSQQTLTSTGSTLFGPLALAQALTTTTAQAALNPIPLVGVTSQKAETGSADANVLTVTPPAVAGTYRACVSISVASATSGVISWTLSWTDSSGNAQSNVAQDLFQDGTAAPNTTFTTNAAGNYHMCRELDVNNAAANIVVKWVGGGTTAAKVSAAVERII